MDSISISSSSSSSSSSNSRNGSAKRRRSWPCYLQYGLLFIAIIGLLLAALATRRQAIAEQVEVGKKDSTGGSNRAPSNKEQQPEYQKKRTNTTSVLQFVHIPKTGGSTIEHVAAKHGIAWGRCHYIPEQSGTPCPIDGKNWHFDLHTYRQATPQPEWWPPFWHVPPRYFRQLNSTIIPLNNPYPTDTPLFAVVRNPYDRLVSEWYFMTLKNQHRSVDYSNNATHFNAFVAQILRAFQRGHALPETKIDMQRLNSYWIHDAHLVPQYDYCFDGNATQIVQHILRFEGLATEFNQLMKISFSNTTTMLLTNDNHDNVVTRDKKLSLWNLTSNNLHLVNEVYRRDFETFGYDMMVS